MSNGTVRKWKKILYEDNGYPDNFTPKECFLAAIEKNKNIRVYNRLECFNGAAIVGTEVSLVVIFWCGYNSLVSGQLFPHHLLVSIFLLMIVGHVIHLGLTRQLRLGSLLSGLRTTLLFSTIGFAMSPILCNLTDSISTDTIHNMAGTSLFVHLLTTDYGLAAPTVSRSTSLNSAVFSAVCLASRFSQHLASFSLLCLAVFCFLLVPLTRPLISSPLVTSWITALAALVWLVLLPSSVPLLILILCLLFLLELVCPLIFHRLQTSKQTIHGPWDEAVPFADHS